MLNRFEIDLLYKVSKITLNQIKQHNFILPQFFCLGKKLKRGTVGNSMFSMRALRTGPTCN